MSFGHNLHPLLAIILVALGGQLVRAQWGYSYSYQTGAWPQQQLVYYTQGTHHGHHANPSLPLMNPTKPNIDAHHPECGLFQRHTADMDLNAFGCTRAQGVSSGSLIRKRRMAGGRTIMARNAPHYAHIVWLAPNGETHQVCGGTIIHKNLVVTAGHCVRDEFRLAGQMAVIVGADWTNFDYGQLRHDGQFALVDRFIIDQDYRLDYHPDYDIAILGLDRNLFYTDRVQPACMRLDLVPQNQATCFDAARGLTSPYMASDWLQGLTMQLDAKSYNRPGNQTFNWWPTEEATICNGDSGSGLICYDECDGSGLRGARAHVVGLATSFYDYPSHKCAPRRQAAGYVNFHASRDKLYHMINQMLV